MTWQITIPGSSFTGTGPYGVVFDDGVGITNNPEAAQALRDMGFLVEELDAGTAPPVPPVPAFLDASAMDAAVARAQTATTVAALRSAVVAIAAAITPAAT